MALGNLETFSFGTNAFDADFEVVKTVTLQKTDMVEGNNKFYQIELHKGKKSGKFRIYSCYGRTGGRTPAKEERIPSSGYEEAEFDWLQKSKEKKKYKKVDMVATKLGTNEGNQKILSQDFKKDKVTAPATSISRLNLDASVSSLVERLYAEAGQSCKSQLNGSLQTTASNPLGTLSLTQIQEGKDILLKANNLLSKKKSLIDSIEPEVLELTNAFYSAIPQEIPLRPKTEAGRKDWMRQYAINNSKILDEKGDLLDLLGDVKGMMAGFATDDLGVKYDELNCTIEPASTQEFNWAKNHLEGSQSRHHSWKLKAKRIWKISSKGQHGYRSYVEKIGNIQPLFHGSRAANIMGICKKGLLLRPPGAYVTGSMFGNGLYFADQSTKSSQYATARYGGDASRYGNSYFMYIADVALGKIKKYQDAQTSLQEAPSGYDSVQGEKGRSLVHNEFIVYNIKQNELKYLIEFEQSY